MKYLIVTLVGLYVFSIFSWSIWILPLWALFAEAKAWQLDFKEKKKSTQVQKKSDKKIKVSFEELGKHNNSESAWVAIERQVYDVTEFVDKHPGGREFLLMHSGKDASVPFISYHPFNPEGPKQILQKYHIGELTNWDTPQFKPDQGFYKECSTLVKDYFKQKGINPKDPIPGFMRALPIWLSMVITYYFAFIKTESFNFGLVMATTFGILQALNTVHWMHDASHGACGNNEVWWWTIGRLTLDWISGSSMLAWHNQHIVGHHAYTNVMGNDPDLPLKTSGDPRRLLKWQDWSKIYKFQHLYMPPLYALVSLRSRYYDIFEIFMCETNGPVKVNPISQQNKLRQSASKAFWFFWRIFLPLHIAGAQIILLFLAAEFATGYWLGFNFQVSHVSSEAEFYYIGERKQLEAEEWAILQVKSSVDYSHNSFLMTFLSGALNYQVIHHLFPGVSQYFYPEIAPLIKQTCKKYGVRYNELPDFKTALMSHLKYLKKMGEEGRPADLKLE